MSTFKSVFKPRIGRQTESLARREPRRLQPGVPGARTLEILMRMPYLEKP